jgi:DNA polymerase III subunit epsilon
MAKRPIFYDTETTGISVSRDRIVELAAYDPIQNRTFEKLINPGCPIPPEVSAIHGITNEMVTNSPCFADVAKEFIEFCDGDVVMIAHNNDTFDQPFMRNEFERHQVSLPAWTYFDSLKWARRYRPDLPRHNLQFLREAYGIAANNAHRALDDVIVLHQIFTMMTDDLSMEQVFELMNRKRDLLHMPFGKHQGKPLNALPKDYLEWLLGSGALDKSENVELRASMQKLGLI